MFFLHPFTFQFVGVGLQWVYNNRCLSSPTDLRANCGSAMESVLPPFHHNFLKAKIFEP